MNSKWLLYSFFALISTAVNLLVQIPFFTFFDGAAVLYVALIFGTMAGLVVKYVLDKRYIFAYQSTGHQDNLHKFGLYSLMGVFTTLLFWGAEMGFYYALDFKGSQYVGGALGLMVGYSVKYYLDKKYVFKVTN